MGSSRRNGEAILVFHIAMWLVAENTVPGKSWQKRRRFFKHGKGDRQGQTCLTRTAEKVLALLEKLCLVVLCHNFIADLCFNLCFTKGNGPSLSSPSCRDELGCCYQADTGYCGCSHWSCGISPGAPPTVWLQVPAEPLREHPFVCKCML